MKKYVTAIVLFFLGFSSFAAFATSKEELQKQLVGTSWYCEGVDVGWFFEGEYLCRRILKCAKMNVFYSLDYIGFEYSLKDNQIWMYEIIPDIECDDIEICVQYKYVVEEITDSTLVLLLFWDAFRDRDPNVSIRRRFVRNTTLPIDNDMWGSGDIFEVDSTIHVPTVEVRSQPLAQVIADFSKKVSVPSESSPFLEARCRYEKDSLVVILTDEIIAPYAVNTIENSVIGICDSMPVLFVGNWPKQMVRKSKGNYPIELYYNKHIKCNDIYYEPSEKYAKKGTVLKVKIPLKK